MCPYQQHKKGLKRFFLSKTIPIHVGDEEYLYVNIHSQLMTSGSIAPPVFGKRSLSYQVRTKTSDYY